MNVKRMLGRSMGQVNRGDDRILAPDPLAEVSGPKGAQPIDASDSNRQWSSAKIEEDLELENPGRLPLHLIEVQSRPYLGEDDIVRFDDVYVRP
jgi:hypothetical protein